LGRFSLAKPYIKTAYASGANLTYGVIKFGNFGKYSESQIPF